MSADNGIYIHKFRNGWKVCHAQAIENIYFEADKSGYNRKYLYEYFKRSPLFKTKLKAVKHAWKLHEDIIKSDFPILEYGISEV